MKKKEKKANCKRALEAFSYGSVGGCKCDAILAGSKHGGAVLAILAASVATYDPLGARWAEEHTPFYGVNLGGWLLTER